MNMNNDDEDNPGHVDPDMIHGDLQDYFGRPAECEDYKFTDFYEEWYKILPYAESRTRLMDCLRALLSPQATTMLSCAELQRPVSRI